MKTVFQNASRIVLALIATALILACASVSHAKTVFPWQAVDAVQQPMRQAQLALLGGDAHGATEAIAVALVAYDNELAPLVTDSSQPHTLAISAIHAAQEAAQLNDVSGFASAYGTLQTALYQISYGQTLLAIQQNNPTAAGNWFQVRGFRHVSRFQRLNVDAIRALQDWREGKLDPVSAGRTIQIDLLDSYQSTLNGLLHDLVQADIGERVASRAEHAAMAAGYFEILTPEYEQERGDKALVIARQAFGKLRDAARQGQPIQQLMPAINEALRGFRAAPLSHEEQTRRANLLLRFVNLVAVEYGRGVKDSQITVDLEIQEAVTFRDGAAAAFADLRSLLDERDPTKAQQIDAMLVDLEGLLKAAKMKTQVASTAQIEAKTGLLIETLTQIMPPEWLRANSAADFDVISTALDKLEAAVSAGQYELAETARLEAYAIFESGPEAKLVVFAPQYKPVLEGVFWYGQDDPQGLAQLIQGHAVSSMVKKSRAALDAQLEIAQKAIAGNNAPEAVATNSAIIVFREGLEAVLIFASLMASFKATAQKQFRKPMWLGTGLALAATALTWVLLSNLLSSLARFGERLEAIVSLVAVAMLLLITNWFFHDIYWTGWMANFHKQKKSIIAGAVGQFIGLTVLGFTSVYREGFETALFLQALVLESGTATVLVGVAIGLLGVVAVGMAVFGLQARLPMKKLLIVTGVMIAAVLFIMVGNTVHVMQIIGWLSISPVRTLNLPYWMGLWLGTYATQEGLILQFASGVLVIGSYFLAEWQQKRKMHFAQSSAPS